MDYAAYLCTEEWRMKASACKWNAGYRCELCNAADKPLHAHHRTYERLGHEEPGDLTCLCEECHAKFHDKEKPSGDGNEPGIALSGGRIVCPFCGDDNVHFNAVDRVCDHSKHSTVLECWCELGCKWEYEFYYHGGITWLTIAYLGQTEFDDVAG